MTFKERATQLADNCTRVKGNNVYETLAKEFGIGKRTAGDRFKSLFGMPIRDYISQNIIPSDEKVIDCLIQSTSYEEFYKLTGINENKRLVPILNRLFGTSSYPKIKLVLQAKQRVKDYVITLADNKSFLISQYLGDGSVERDNSFKIEHGYKQYDYLKFKIGMFNTMYPKTNGLENVRKRTHENEYVSYVYRTGEVLSKQLSTIINRPFKDIVNEMTPLGVMVYFMDDGYFSHNEEYNTWELAFSTVNEELQDVLVEYFSTYGYKFNKTSKSVALQRRVDVVKFIQEFIEPFKAIIPKCMHYKFNYEDIVGNM